MVLCILQYNKVPTFHYFLLSAFPHRPATEWSGPNFRSESGRRKRRRRNESVSPMPRLTGMILWWWKRWTSSPLSKVDSLILFQHTSCPSQRLYKLNMKRSHHLRNVLNAPDIAICQSKADLGLFSAWMAAHVRTIRFHDGREMTVDVMNE